MKIEVGKWNSKTSDRSMLLCSSRAELGPWRASLGDRQARSRDLRGRP